MSIPAPSMPAQYVFNSISPRHSVELFNFADLVEEQFDQWSNLSQCALTPNPFFEPQFVRPLVECLGNENLKLLVVLDDARNWLFAAPVVQHFFEQGLPLPKFRALRSDYIFLDTPLISKHDTAFILTCLLSALSSQRDWHGLGFSKTVANSEQSDLIDFVATVSDAEVKHTTLSERPCVTPQTQAELLSKCSASRRKTLRKGWKKFSQAGDVEFRLRKLPSEIPSAIDSFLELEALGWKGEQGTALSCEPSHAAFFSKMCAEFSKFGRLVFGEILLNNRVIASTCNLLSGNTLFAFKIGWDHNYSNYSLGYWSEILLADAIHHEAKEVRLIDSCSEEDSYTGKVWQDRIEIGSTILIWSRRAKLMRDAKKVVKKLVKK